MKRIVSREKVIAVAAAALLTFTDIYILLSAGAGIGK